MNLSSLLKKHADSNEKRQLTGNLGDGYLLKNNSLYKKVRETTLSLGFSYSDTPSPEYLALPMGQLESILKSKTIPYVNNVTPLENLNQLSGKTLEWDHVVDNLKPNYVLHESCHAIARSIGFKGNTLQEKITSILLEESFANTCEFFAIKDANDVTHKLFLEMNSYYVVFENRTHLKNALDKMGEAEVFKFMLLCYLQSNFLDESLDNKVFELCDIKNPDTKALKALSKNAFALNPRFRYTTSEMYLRLNGVTDPAEKVLKFDYLKLVEKSDSFSKLSTCLK